VNQISAQNLDEGDELGLYETPECCDASMDEAFVNGHLSFQCGRCESYVDVDDSRTVTRVSLV
jgi:transcription initiation factor IIE alpha subunit